MSDKRNVSEIIRDYLVEQGFDGLYSPLGECACKVSDLAPCGDLDGHCVPGFLVITTDVPEGRGWSITSEHEVALRAALRACLNCMEMQENRESGAFHLSGAAFRPLWDAAKNAARHALELPEKEDDDA